jgi:hypothetical protein
MDLYVKIEGTWHKANEEQTETICGLDPDDVEDAREGRQPPFGATLCGTCFPA